MFKTKWFWVLFAWLLVLIVPTLTASAHQPILERDRALNENEQFELGVYPLKDPTTASLAVYGRLSSPTEVDNYSFTVSKSGTIPMQLLVPVRFSNQAFEPELFVLKPGIPSQGISNLPVEIPPEYQAQKLSSPRPWQVFFEPFSFERLYRVAEAKIEVNAGETYYLMVYSPNHCQGDYTLGVGSVENFSDITLIDTMKSVAQMKLGLVDAQDIPWMDINGLFLFWFGITVSLIALICTTIRNYMLWIGFCLALLGAVILYRATGTNGVATFQLFLAIIVLGCNTAISRAPRKPDSLTSGHLFTKIIAIVAWIVIALLLIWYVLISR
ncbi:MAG: hypothetical protein GYA42_07395 [Syntrophomonadaceae bacterium]|nr:hypothetical protein [Syntrophomonadaceae bacterium]